MSGGGVGELPGLLTIDVSAEIRKTAAATLEGAWQVPAELVRRALAAGACRVDVRTGPGRVEVRDDGGGLDRPALDRLAALLDDNAEDARRHRGLVAMEAAGETSLLALAGLTPRRVRLETVDGRLEFERGRPPRVTEAPGPAAGTRVVLHAAGLDPGAVRQGLRALCRFAQAAVTVDGEEIPRGLGPTLGRRRLDPPLDGEIALPRDGDVARLWLLHDGVVGAHLTFPEAPAFVAVAEMSGLVGPMAGPAALREAVGPHVAGLVDQAVRLALALVPTLPGRPAIERKALRGILLRAARSSSRSEGRRWRTAEVLRAAVFPAIDGPEGREERWLGLLDLTEGGRGRALWALDPERDAGAHLLPAGPVLRLDADERARLSELLGVAFRLPQERPRSDGFAARLRRTARAALRAARRAAAFAVHPVAGARLADTALTPAERALLEGLRAQSGEDVAFTRGRGPVRRDRRRWLLARDADLVRAAVRAVERDTAWTYPATLALLEDAAGHAGRRAWLAREVY